MKIQLREGLPFVSVVLTHAGRQLTLQQVLLDTGSAGTLFAADQLLPLGLQLEPHDSIRRIYGVGGAEFVFVKHLDRLAVGKLQLDQVLIEVGALGYGLPLDGILGMDFLLRAGARINLAKLTLS